MERSDRIVLTVLAAWTAVAVALALGNEGLSANNVTRIAVLLLLAARLALWWATRHRPMPARAWSFVWRCAFPALLVELCYMVSRPVFPTLLWQRSDAPAQLVEKALIDFAFTLPAYLVIYTVCWLLLSRFSYRLWQIIVLFSLGQALGDGNAFFRAHPLLLLLAPYVMLNYQAILVVPVLRVHRQLRGGGPRVIALLAPVVLLPLTYWFMGALIIVAGRAVGLVPN